MSSEIHLEPSWKKVLGAEFAKPYMLSLKAFLTEQKKQRKIIYPKGQNIFKAFELTPFDKVKVVILGQDPYHGPNQAHGLCFSVPSDIALPPSLLNIYKELEQDVGFKMVNHGCLTYWAKQGVLLLNSVLTVEKGLAASHQGQGWEIFTDQVIQALNERDKPMIFLLWGSYAQKKGQLIQTKKHQVLKTTHPSPLSAHRGFLGCRHFSQCNAILQSWGETPIDWQLPLKIKEGDCATVG